MRPLGWVGRLLLLVLIAVPSLIYTSSNYAVYANKLPDPGTVTAPIPEDTILYAADGKTVLADLHPPGYQHYYEPLQSMGTLLPQAVLSIEDRNFYNEPGVDPGGVARAAIIDWRAHQNVQGASTITQQLVKLRLVGNEVSLDRKFREALLAFEIERRYTKSAILEMYLTSAFFGNSAWGSAAAAQIYYHTTTKNLDLAQASMLAGLIRGPSVYNPLLDWKAAKARQADVLQAMVRDQKITADQAAQAFVEDISAPNHMYTPINQILAPAFVRYVTGQLVARFGADSVYTGGLQVTTTLNWKLQELAQKTVTGTVKSLAYRRVSQGALVSIDPSSGAIVAMVGSANPKANGGQYNLAVWPPRNPGSSMKIFTYTTAIASRKYTMTTSITDSAFSYRDPASGEVYTPRNYDGRYHGTLQLQEAMANSLNIPAVKVELGVGVSSVVNMARAMGAPPWQLHFDKHGNPIYTNNDRLNTYGPSLTLGGYGETPLQMATGASVLAAKGVLHPPFAITQIKKDGTVLFAQKPGAGSKKVLDPRVAFIMGQIMSDDYNRRLIFGMGSILTLAGHRVAVKTGTTDQFADAWTIGFTPHLVTAVWVGNPDWRQKMTEGSDSFYTAAPVWHNYMTSALPFLKLHNEWYKEPNGLINRV
ncbi:MAG TPA: transglycosylase domain-containing protein, partial [Candidatus Dormibacteraeota bacterium]